MDRSVQRGAEVLDRIRPGWENQINSVSLDIANPFCCTLAQVFKAEQMQRGVAPNSGRIYDRETPYHFGLDVLRHEAGLPFNVQVTTLGAGFYGFVGNYETTLEWRDLVARRRLKNLKKSETVTPVTESVS